MAVEKYASDNISERISDLAATGRVSEKNERFGLLPAELGQRCAGKKYAGVTQRQVTRSCGRLPFVTLIAGAAGRRVPAG